MDKPVVEERFEYKGFSCVVLFQPLGYRTGYVGLTKGHKYYKKDYDELSIDCHCGLTYSREYLYGQEDKETWWIGFDCGHCCDGYDLEKLDEYFGYSSENRIMRNYLKLINEEYEFRTLEYVKENCKGIVDQLIQKEVKDE